MITDALVNPIPIGTNLAILGIPVRSNVYDILGSGPGTAPANIIGNRTIFSSDLGIGGKKAQLEVLLGTAFAGGAGLNVQFQAAPDLGVGGGYLPGNWTTLVETGEILVANLTADQVLARFDWPPAFPAGLSTRFYSFNFVPTGVFTAGTINGAVVTMVRDDQANKYATKNFTVA